MPVQYVYENSARIDIGDHVFPTGKYAELARRVREELGVPSQRFHGWEEVTDEDLERVHTPHYLEDLREARSSWATRSSELPVTARVIEGFRLMTGGSIRAVRLALEHGVGFHLGGGFHHAFPDHGEGFCYLHDMAIAVERLRAEEGIDRVLFVDVDVHQGNGTVAVYKDDPDTFTYSIHQHDNYPPKQRGDLDRGLADGVGDDEYLSHLAADLQTVDDRFGADLVCYVGESMRTATTRWVGSVSPMRASPAATSWSSTATSAGACRWRSSWPGATRPRRNSRPGSTCMRPGLARPQFSASGPS